MSLIRRLVSPLLAAAALLSPLPALSQGADVAAPAPKLLLVLDASGSMNEKDPGGGTKMAAAKQALTSVVQSLPRDVDVGLRVYGATQPGGKPTPAACADTQLVHAIAPLDQAGLSGAIAGFQAKGETPIAHALGEALKDLGSEGKRSLILVSDGEESCVADPCPVIGQLLASGVDVRIDTVGFGVNPLARKQLQCIANAGGGQYYDARDARALETSLSKLSLRAARAFALSGKRVRGTPQQQGAPVLQAGQYVDGFTTGAARKHYRLRRTLPGSTLYVAVSARPRILDAQDSTEILRFDIRNGDKNCLALNGMPSRIGLSSMQSVITDTRRVDGAADARGDCGSVGELSLDIRRDEGSTESLDAEILVIEEPGVRDSAALPPRIEALPDGQPATVGTPTPVVGGSGFSDAPLLTPGTYRETFVPRETIFYRVAVGWGQRLRVTVLPPAFDADRVSLGPLYDAMLFNPARDRVRTRSSGMGHTNGAAGPVVRQAAELRYLNRNNPGDTDSASLAGQHYIAIAMPDANSPERSGLLEVSFRIDVEGPVQGAPDYVATSAASAAATAEQRPAGPTPSPPDAGATTSITRWVVIGVVSLLVLLALGLVLRRKR
jgi:Ca-activated chloride channel family protein